MFCKDSVVVSRFSFFHAENGVYNDRQCDVVRVTITIVSVVVTEILKTCMKFLVELIYFMLIIWFRVLYKMIFEGFSNALFRGNAIDNGMKVVSFFVVDLFP